MRLLLPLILSVALLGSGSPPARAADPSAEVDASAPAPARVLEHTLEVTFDAGGRLSTRQTWRLRIEDPAACAMGLVAPPGLEGATDRGARVKGDLLLLPTEVAPGDVFTLIATSNAPKGPAAGVFAGAPGLPVDRSEVRFRAPQWVPLGVQADLTAVPTIQGTSTRTATWSWEPRDAHTPASLVWSTWPDWLEAGARMEEAVTARVATRNQLGRRLAADLSTVTLEEAIERVWLNVAIAPGPTRWETSAHAVEIAQRGSGSAVERGVVLISLLRAAGFEARPALVRPASQGAVPTHLAVPGLFDLPAVAVTRGGRTVWIDPAAELARPGLMPESLRHGQAWAAGDLPLPLHADALLEGELTVLSELRIGADGRAAWTASLVAVGSAEDHLRQRLADSKSRNELITRLLREAHPAVEGVTVDTEGFARRGQGVRITLTASEPGLMREARFGAEAEATPLLATALLAWLPPGVAVRERLSVGFPQALTLQAVHATPTPSHPSALLTRSTRREGARVIVEVDGYRARTQADAAFAAWAAAGHGPAVAVRLTPHPTPEVLAALRREQPLGLVGSLGVASLLTRRADQGPKADKLLRRALSKGGVEGVLAQVLPWLDDDDTDLLTRLWDLCPEEADRLTLLRALAARDPEVWRRAASLSTSATPAIRAEALRIQAIHQPSTDPGGPSPWRPLPELLARLAEVADDPALDLPVRAHVALARFDAGEDVTAELDALLAAAPNARLRAAHAQALAQADAPRERVLDAVHATLADPTAAGDVDAHRRLADALARAGAAKLAADHAVLAARLGGRQPALWTRASELLLAQGLHGSALGAARLASDLAPGDPQAATRLALLAVLAHDAEGRDVAANRGGALPSFERWPPPLGALIPSAPPEALLALLVWHEAATVADPRLLGLRAQLRADAGDLEGAARDGLLLTTRHQEARGYALAYAALAGRVWGGAAREQLNLAARREVRARALRMEIDLLTGSGQPQEDARLLGDDPRAAVVLALAARKLDALPPIAGWPPATPGPAPKAPRGLRANALLSAPAGVTAWSDPDRALALLHVSGEADAALPPPLAWWYTPAAAPLVDRDGLRVLALEGGQLPVYVAIEDRPDGSWFGVAFTPEAARRALALAP